jgi:hypothetical protein
VVVDIPLVPVIELHNSPYRLKISNCERTVKAERRDAPLLINYLHSVPRK